MSTTAEYNAFGPWIYEIRSEEEIPRLFREYPLDLENAALTIKVPRPISRRDANPSMDLYDIVLSLGPDNVTILHRSGGTFDFRDIAYDEIQGITDFVDLLDGRLTLAAEAGEVTVKYNSSSNEIIAHLVQLIRDRYVVHSHEGSQGPPPASVKPAPVERELGILHGRVNREGANRTIAVQERRLVTPLEASFVDRAVARAWPTTLQSAIFVLGTDELQVLHRGRPFQTGYKPVHALARTLLPLARVAGIETRRSQQYEGVSTLLVRIGHVSHEFSADNTIADAVLAEVRSAVRG